MQIPFSFWKTASPKRKRLYSTIFMLVLAVAATLIGTLVPLSAQDAKQLNDQVAQISQNKTSVELAEHIFTNNFSLCLLMFIPVAGAVIGLFIMFSTGIAIGAELQVQSASSAPATVAGMTATTAAIALAFIAITFLVEYVSYSVGMTESVWLFVRLNQRRWRELKNTAKLIGLVAVLLTIGAIVETWVITTLG